MPMGMPGSGGISQHRDRQALQHLHHFLHHHVQAAKAACAMGIAICMFPGGIFNLRLGGYGWPITLVEAWTILAFGFTSLLYTEIGLCIHKRMNIMPFVAWLTTAVIICFIPLLLFAFATFTYEGKGYDFSHMLITTPFYLIALNDHSLKITDIVCWFGPFFALVAYGFAFPYILEQ